MTQNSKLIVALDMPEKSDIISLAKKLSPYIAMTKIGLETFVAHGPDIVKELRAYDIPVFLDLKLYDIPRTVAATVKAAVKLEVELLTIHSSGGEEMIKVAVDAAAGKTKIIAVTALTSFDTNTVKNMNIEKMGALAIAQGADGLVCSASDLKNLKFCGGLRLVPGIRPIGTDRGDQKRTATPIEAIILGADYLVIGRPILEASNPITAIKTINNQLI